MAKQSSAEKLKEKSKHKGTENFEKVIENYLKKLAFSDPLFRKTFAKENKNITDCVTYILNTVKASGMQGFTDDEIFGMAVHYYDEDNLKPGKRPSGNIVVNHQVQLSEEEIEDLKEKARKEVMEEQRQKMLKKNSKSSSSKEETPKESQGSLF